MTRLHYSNVEAKSSVGKDTIWDSHSEGYENDNQSFSSAKQSNKKKKTDEQWHQGFLFGSSKNWIIADIRFRNSFFYALFFFFTRIMSKEGQRGQTLQTAAYFTVISVNN